MRRRLMAVALISISVLGFSFLFILATFSQPTELPPLPTPMVLPSTTTVPITVMDAATTPDESAFVPAVDATVPVYPSPTPNRKVVDAVDLSNPVTDQVVVAFAPDTSPDEQAAYIASIGGTISHRIDALDVVVVQVPQAVAIQSLPASPIVVASEPDYYVTALIDVPTSDAYYSSQWALPVIGAPEAWSRLPENAPTVAVAVIDSGVCLEHPDLEAKILPGYDFVQNDTTPQDEFDHGCGVAGIIAAAIDNGIGIAGVAPNARIMPLRVLDAHGIGTYSDVAAAVVYAANNGAQIINLSLGGSNTSSLLQNAIDYAATHGVMVIAASGNTGQRSVLYPAAYSGVIAVGSVDPDLQRSSFTSYGLELDLLAPGRDILTTSTTNNYASQTGTSFAAPQVAGVAALEIALGRTLLVDSGIVAVQSSTVVAENPTPTSTALPPNPVTNPLSDGRQTGEIQRGEKLPEYPTFMTDEWAVRLKSDANADVIAANLGFENLGPVGELPNTYLFRQVGTAGSALAAQNAAGSLATANDVIFSAQQTLRYPGLRVPTDPLYPDQWHLHNTGQSGGTVGADVNVVPAWNAGYDGTGVTIAVVDSGLEYTHPDIAPNYLASASWDFNEGDSDPFPGVTASDGHGTMSAGIAAAADDGSSCGVGAAYNAKLSGIRLTASAITDAMVAEALNYAYQTNDIYNNSWGPPDGGAYWWDPADFPLTSAAIENAVANGRGGLGNIFVWAGGNGRNVYDFLPWDYPFDNVNRDLFANSHYTIAVAALDDEDVQSWYSEPGAPLLVAAPGGRVDDPYRKNDIGLTTTDLTGSSGLNTAVGTAGDCTDEFVGTSASAPLVSGVIGLMLDANPNLTWRDVQHILVETAVQNDPTNEGLDSDWTTNAAGYLINHAYGFGKIDAAAAVALAETWTNVGPEVSHASPISTANKGIEDATSNWSPKTYVHDGIFFDQNIIIEHVEVVFNGHHTYRGDLDIILTSPTGTQSHLLPFGIDPGEDYTNLVLSSTRHWGEESYGVWTLSVADAYPGDTGTFDDWQLIIYGTAGPPRSDTDIQACGTSLFGAIIYANSNPDPNTIQMCAGSTLTLKRAQGNSTYETALPPITTPITIEGNGSTIERTEVTISFRLFSVSQTGDLTLNNLTLQKGYVSNNYPGGGIYNNGGVVTLNDSTLTNNTSLVSDYSGAAIFNINNGTVTINNSVISNSSGRYKGGAIYNFESTFTANNSVISDNTLTYGYQTYHGGGAIYNEGSVDTTAVLNLNNTLVEGNTTTFGSGGAVYNADNAELNITGGQFSNNTAVENGGAIFAWNGQITGATFNGNTASSGQGGAIYQSTYGLGRMRISDSSFWGNTAFTRGGAISARDDVYLDIINTTISGNSAGTDGGGIFFNPDNPARLSNVTVTNNTAAGNGGGIRSMPTSSTHIEIKNSILFGNIDTSPVSSPSDCYNELHTWGNNIIGDMTGCTTLVEDGSNLVGDPVIGPLQDNGGPTHTHALLGGSPAINAAMDCTTLAMGSPPTSEPVPNDQRGIPRPQDGDCDIGAFELTTIMPDPPSGLYGIGLSHTEIELNWSDNSDDETHFRIEHSPDGSDPWTEIGIVGANVITFVDDTVTCGTTHYYRVRAYRSLDKGYSAYSDVAEASPWLCPPTAPSELSLEIVVGQTQFDLSWTDNSDESDFYIYRSPAGEDNWEEVTSVGQDTTTYRDTAPACYTSYDYRVRAWRDFDSQFSEYSNIATGGTSCTEVYPPSDLAVTDTGDTRIDMTWTDNSPDEASFHIEHSLDGSTGWAEIDSVLTDVTAYADNAPVCGVSNYYRVLAYRSGDGAYSLPSNVADTVAICPPPADPTNLAGSGISQTEIELTWTDNSVETEFRIERAPVGTEDWVEVGAAGPDETSYTDSILTCSTFYRYRIQAYRDTDAKSSGYSNNIVVSTQFCPPPNAPTGLATSGITQNQIDLTWTDNSSDEDSFQIERSPNGSTDWQPVGSVPVDETSYQDTALGCGTTYSYRVHAYRQYDGQFSAYTNVVSPTTQACPAPEASTIGLYKNGVWQFRNSNDDGPAELRFGFGPTESDWTALVGDWDGDGTDGIGVYKNGGWYLRNSASSGVREISFFFNPLGNGALPIVGDWNRDGIDTIGVYKNGVWILRNSNSAGDPEVIFMFGADGSGWLPIAGDWDGDNQDTVGLYKDHIWYLHNSLTNVDRVRGFAFGPAESGWLPVIGDWDKDGVDTIGLYKNGIWRLRNSNSEGTIDLGFHFIANQSGWQPVAGYRGGVSGLSALGLGEVWQPQTPEALPTNEPTPSPPAVETETSEVTETSEPVITEEAPVTTVPEVTDEPTVTEVPVITEEPSATSEPAATEEPVITELPPAAETTEEP